jgi:NADH:ubiquinone oxidoreductase subunit 3 (subunit A)
MKFIVIFIITIIFLALIVLSLVLNNLLTRNKNKNTSSYCAAKGEGYACWCGGIENCNNGKV